MWLRIGLPGCAQQLLDEETRLGRYFLVRVVARDAFEHLVGSDEPEVPDEERYVVGIVRIEPCGDTLHGEHLVGGRGPNAEVG